MRRNWGLFLTFMLFAKVLLAQSVGAGIKVVVSGHVLVGMEVNYRSNEHHEWQVTWLPLGFPERPMAVGGGYRYWLGSAESRWRPYVGLEGIWLMSPPQNGKRKTLILFNVVPGVAYRTNQAHIIRTAVWISFLRKRGKSLVFPTGLVVQVGKQW